jgi:Phosphodiester glycosidase
MRPNFSWTSHFLSGALVVSLGVLLGCGFTCWGRPAAAEIFEGVTYGCEQMQLSDEGSGVIHWARIDLTAPGIELYLTPKDPMAISQGWQYRLRRVGDVVATEHLAIAINGALFKLKSDGWPRMSGEFAKGVEPVVVDHVVSHFWGDTYFLWFDDNLTPHLRPSKPLRVEELSTAKWGIGGQDLWLRDGRVWSDDSRCLRPGARTAVAVDLSRKLLFLAVGTHISPRLLFKTLANLGAKDGMLLDGGDSSSVAIGKGAKDVSAGAVYGGWRPIATHFGVRAQALR